MRTRTTRDAAPRAGARASPPPFVAAWLARCPAGARSPCPAARRFAAPLSRLRSRARRGSSCVSGFSVAWGLALARYHSCSLVWLLRVCPDPRASVPSEHDTHSATHSLRVRRVVAPPACPRRLDHTTHTPRVLNLPSRMSHATRSVCAR